LPTWFFTLEGLKKETGEYPLSLVKIFILVLRNILTIPIFPFWPYRIFCSTSGTYLTVHGWSRSPRFIPTLCWCKWYVRWPWDIHYTWGFFRSNRKRWGHFL